MKAYLPFALTAMVCGLCEAQQPSGTLPTPATPSAPPTLSPATGTPPSTGAAVATPPPPGTPASPAPTEDEAAAIHKMLGTMSPNLVAALSMDNEANGSMIMSRPPSKGQAIFSLKKQFGMDQGRQCADFSAPGTMLSLYRLNLGPTWTLAMWAKLPFTGDEAVLWRGASGNLLCVRDSKFKCVTNANSGVTEATFGEYDKAWTGWHHIALASDGNTNTLYVDGMPIGTAPATPNAFLSYIGGQSNLAAPRPPTPSGASIGGATTTAAPSAPTSAANYQCSLLDDMFVFDKALNAEDLEQLAMVRLPSHELVTIPQPGATANPGQVATPMQPAPASSESSTLATELVKSFSNSLVFVTGEGAGSGFIADMGGKPFLVTNAHVAAGVRGAAFRTLQGTSVNIGPASVALGHDIFVMQAKTVDNPMTIMRDVGENAAINDEVVVLGNAQGGGVINTLMGRIVGIGPDRVEVDAPFLPGNSGSPIIHLKSKKVIGIATYMTIQKYDPATKQPVLNPVVKRFGYRIDSVKTWQPVDWNAFYAQATEIDNIEKMTDDLVALIKDIADDSRIIPGKHTNPAIRARIDAWLASKSKHLSAKDSKYQDQNFLSFLKIACQTDITNARQRLTYDYFIRQLNEQQQGRTDIANVFIKIIDTVRSER